MYALRRTVSGGWHAARTLSGASHYTPAPWTIRNHAAAAQCGGLARPSLRRFGCLQFDVAQERGQQRLRMPEDREAAAAPVVLTVALASSRGGALARVQPGLQL